MAAVAAFLQAGAARPYPTHYMDTAIQTYKDTCKYEQLYLFVTSKNNLILNSFDLNAFILKFPSVG